LAAGFNLQPRLAGGEAAAGLGACKGAAQRQTKGEARRAEQPCEPCKGPAAFGGRPQKKKKNTIFSSRSLK